MLLPPKLLPSEADMHDKAVINARTTQGTTDAFDSIHSKPLSRSNMPGYSSSPRAAERAARAAEASKPKEQGLEVELKRRLGKMEDAIIRAEGAINAQQDIRKSAWVGSRTT